MGPVKGAKLETFETRIDDLQNVDPTQLHALSISVAWPHRLADWLFLREIGQGLALTDEIGRVLGTIMWFRDDDRFAMIGMMITSPRLQEHGAGRLLLQEAMNRNAGLQLGLTATKQARRLYRSFGFGFEQAVQKRQGDARPIPAPALTLQDGADLDLHALARLDASAISHSREGTLRALLAASRASVLNRDGQPAAYALSRPFGRGHVIGPVIAGRDEDAIAVVAPHVHAHQGGFLRLDTPATTGAFADFLTDSGLAVQDDVTSMGLTGPSHAPRDPKGPRRYALASQALG